MEPLAADEQKKRRRNILWRIFTVVAVLQTVVLILVSLKLPARVPVHFNYAMKPDRYGSPWELCITSMLVPLLFLLRPLIDLKYSQNPRNVKIEDGIILFTGAFLAALSWWNVWLAFIPENLQSTYAARGLPSLLLVPLGVFAIVLGNYLGIIKPNRTLGIRVKWTLEDPENWRRTHRFAGPFCILGGIVLIVSSGMGMYTKQVLWYVFGLLVLLILLSIVPIIYSWRISRKKIDKR